MNVLKSIFAGITGIGMLFGGLFGAHQTQNIGAAYNPTGGGTYYLESGIGLTDTTVYLTSFEEPVSNIPYTMTYLNSSVEFGTLDSNSPTKREFISFTGITQNTDGTAILTGVTRGLSPSYPFTASSTFETTHTGQSTFVLSNTPQFYQQYASLANNQTITGSWFFPAPSSSTNAITVGYGSSTYAIIANNNTFTGNNTFNGLTTLIGTTTSNASTTYTGVVTFTTSPLVPTPTTASQAASKAYVDGVAISGAPIANSLTTGLVRVATSSLIAAGTASSTFYAIPASLASSTASSTSISVATKLSTGKIDPSFLSGTTENYTLNGSTALATTTISNLTVSATSTLATTTVTGALTLNGIPIVAQSQDVLVYATTSATTTTITSSAEATIASWTLPANTMGTNGLLHLRIYAGGTIYTSGATQNINFKFYLGSQSVTLGIGASTVQSLAIHGYADFYIGMNGVTNSESAVATGIFTNNFDLHGSIGASTDVWNQTSQSAGALTVDTTSNQTMKITGQLTSSGSQTLTTSLITAEVI